jgi:hypothetical protein
MRPAKYMPVSVIANATPAVAAIYPAGDVVPASGSTALFGLDGVSFRAEQ